MKSMTFVLSPPATTSFVMNSTICLCEPPWKGSRRRTRREVIFLYYCALAFAICHVSLIPTAHAHFNAQPAGHSERPRGTEARYEMDGLIFVSLYDKFDANVNHFLHHYV